MKDITEIPWEAWRRIGKTAGLVIVEVALDPEREAYDDSPRYVRVFDGYADEARRTFPDWILDQEVEDENTSDGDYREAKYTRPDDRNAKVNGGYTRPLVLYVRPPWWKGEVRSKLENLEAKRQERLQSSEIRWLDEKHTEHLYDRELDALSEGIAMIKGRAWSAFLFGSAKEDAQ